MKLGIIGKPQSGKTTVFNAAANQQETVGDFSKAIHRALIKVPDKRLDVIAAIIKPKKVTPSQIEFLDAPGLSGKGKESGTVEISDDLRQADAFMLVIDAFSPDARIESDIQSLTDEMILVNQLLVESIIDKRTRRSKLTGDKSQLQLIDLLQRCLETLQQERPLLDMEFTQDENKILKGYQFLTTKPQLVVLNISEDDITRADEIIDQYRHLIQPGKRELAAMCGKIEMELVGLDADEKQAFMQDLGIKASATDTVIHKSYALLGLISFITAGDTDVRAWAIRKGTTAQKAAGVVHSDLERGFIRAEVIAFEDYAEYKTYPAMKAAGKFRIEGKDYVVDDGDVLNIRFNV
ncbi:MAG: redox-regulated ATPase YchF [Candidatus Zixiibacteriota bacterium]|nr:MAG: redox-regulated ATPase YchF [candidate division Zixibacteria bacterium]